MGETLERAGYTETNVDQIVRDNGQLGLEEGLAGLRIRRDADRILVLERCRVVEDGTHDELIAHQGLYYYLASQQLGI